MKNGLNRECFPMKEDEHEEIDIEGISDDQETSAELLLRHQSMFGGNSNQRSDILSEVAFAEMLGQWMHKHNSGPEEVSEIEIKTPYNEGYYFPSFLIQHHMSMTI
jgi:hypothetical protein